MSRRAALAASLLWPAAGCFGPSLPESISCAAELICPDGYFCDLDQQCKPLDNGDGDDGGGDVSAFCADPDIALCLEFEGDVDDGSRSRRETMPSSSPQFAQGVSGMAIHFDGNYGVLAFDYRPDSAGETVELWTTLPNPLRQTVLAIEDGFVIELVSGRIRLSASFASVVSAPLLTGGYHHVAARSAGGQVSLFVDGNDEGSLQLDLSGSPNLSLGGNLDQDRFTGDVDQLRVWTRPLDNGEIDTIARGN